MHSLKVSLFGLLAAAAPALFAHGLWIEPSKEGLSIHYGEYSHGEKEKKDKLAELFGMPDARDAQGRTLPVAIGEDGFRVSGSDARSALVASVTKGPIYGEGAEAVRYQAYLRYAPTWGRAAEPAPAFPVDVVPAEGKKPAFVVYKNGKAAGGAWVEVTAPNGWSKWFEADSSGRVTIQAPWSGLYLVHAEHEDTASGTQDGKAYAKSHQSATLSIRKP